MSTKALVVVDIQNDFLPGGALAVPDGDEVIPVINAAMARFDVVVATQDWHPPGHGSFASSHPGKEPGDVVELAGVRQVLWPDHCVQGTRGARLAEALDREPIRRVFHKGTHRDVDSYSTFFDNAHEHETGLRAWLEEREIREIALAGLATDYCVLYSVRDARELGLDTTVIADACRGIGLREGDVERAIEEMRRLGAHVVTSEDLGVRRPGAGAPDSR